MSFQFDNFFLPTSTIPSHKIWTTIREGWQPERERERERGRERERERERGRARGRARERERERRSHKSLKRRGQGERNNL